MISDDTITKIQGISGNFSHLGRDLGLTFPNLKIGPGLIITPAQEVAALSAQDYVVPWDLGLNSLD